MGPDRLGNVTVTEKGGHRAKKQEKPGNGGERGGFEGGSARQAARWFERRRQGMSGKGRTETENPP